MIAVFKSWFRLQKESVARYSLFGTLFVPNNAITIDSLEFSVPDGILIPDTFFPVQINLEQVRSVAGEGFLWVHTPLDFRATATAALPVGGATGKTHVMLFVVIS